MEQKKFTEGKILSHLIKFALPVLLAIFLQTMYGAVDLLVVGQFSTAAHVSAVSTGSWVMQTITSVIVGLAMGTTVLLGRRIGEGKARESGLIVGSSIALFAVIGVVITIAMQFAAVPIAHAMQCPAEAFEPAVEYMRICSGGAIFIVAYNILGSIFRGIGNSKMPLLTVFIACILNIAGDLLLVGVFGMASAGAAIATVFAQAVSVVLSVVIITRKKLPFEFRKKDVRFHTDTIKQVIKLGSPIAIQDLLVCISFLVINAIVNGLGVVASAGVGVAEKVCGFVMLVPSAFMQSMSAFVAQNIGAGKADRAKKALQYGIICSLIAGAAMAYVAFFHGDFLAGLFAGKDAAVVSAGAEYLKSYAIDCLLVCFLFCFIGYFNGCGHTTFVMIQGICGAFGVRVPLSYILSGILPVSLFRIGLATPASTVVQITMCLIYYAIAGARHKRQSSGMQRCI